MERHTIEPRPGWQQTVEAQGLIYPLTRYPDDSLRPYWDESAYYSFTLPEVEALEDVVEELHGMCLAAADHLVEQDRLADLGIEDPRLARLVAESWRRRDELPSLYGRFDLHYDGSGPAKMLEYNADTPTSLVEAASPQWFWMEERFPGADQWNSLHERLVAAWKRQAPLLPPGAPVHFAHSAGDELGEDLMTVAYLEETAQQAGLETVAVSMEDIGWDRLSGRFVDQRLRFMRACFKLYPWEWLATDDFGPFVLDTLDNGGGTGSTLWIEPAWKMLLSNKALLAILWELYPGHPNLLPAYLDGPRELAHTRGYAAKPLLGREGAGVTLHEPGAEPVPRGPEDACCYQELAPLPDFDGNRVVLGAWVVEDESAGLGIRESAGPVTDEYARFLPHVIR
ncbi:Glutathionylspermidine synthase [Streptomyces sp. 2224.1]|uniref:glutathionylspermidine synthase family protein n=1 Tax=unclassified Streptomyces TaxID=2593676 RepID=UPI00088C4144|nr:MULTISPECIES: glutathionylspermidine synthase family protein [unclassified Streptomyces]PBC84555.1 glutathionylspermidine synthase [Streptomyces sp. 2321.6]SDR29083.1 Glutathionylspermidine synthase [Streptomyces sp. KS_16]SEB67591.1 Glutathionylspermidine synthase [Streptomyces sp. 2224.1]SED35665.1 Glutathionylspermidine synthase [Streptomyces sp. 2133.1]SNC70638.1 Glutathionylspermidine synthase [Streptomyces sp. 2114.4]